MVFAARTVDRPVPPPARRNAGTDVPPAVAPGAADGVRRPLRPAAYPLGGAVPVAGRDLRLRDLQTLRRTDDGGGAERRLPGPGVAVRPFVGHHLGPEQIYPRDDGVVVVESYAGHARRGDGLFGQLSEVAGFRGQDPDAGRLVQPRGAQPGGGPFGAADPRDDVLERLVPGSADRDGDHSGFRRESRGDLPRMRRPLRACRRGIWR